jgi:hypothetical protein
VSLIIAARNSGCLIRIKARIRRPPSSGDASISVVALGKSLGEANDVPARTKPACGVHQSNSTAALKSWNVPGADSTGTRQGPVLSVRDPSHARDCAFGIRVRAGDRESARGNRTGSMAAGPMAVERTDGRLTT